MHVTLSSDSLIFSLPILCKIFHKVKNGFFEDIPKEKVLLLNNSMTRSTRRLWIGFIRVYLDLIYGRICNYYKDLEQNKSLWRLIALLQKESEMEHLTMNLEFWRAIIKFYIIIITLFFNS